MKTKNPTILLVPGFPLLEGKKCIYSDGSVRLLSDVQHEQAARLAAAQTSVPVVDIQKTGS